MIDNTSSHIKIPTFNLKLSDKGGKVHLRRDRWISPLVGASTMVEDAAAFVPFDSLPSGESTITVSLDCFHPELKRLDLRDLYEYIVKYLEKQYMEKDLGTQSIYELIEFGYHLYVQLEHHTDAIPSIHETHESHQLTQWSTEYAVGPLGCKSKLRQLDGVIRHIHKERDAWPRILHPLWPELSIFLI